MRSLIPSRWRTAALGAALAAFAAGEARAQAGPYVNTTSGSIDGTTTCGGGELTRSIVVGDSFTITDLDVGFIASHTWRLDIETTLTSPQGTSVQIIDGPAGTTNRIDSYNILLDDAAADLINTGGHTGADLVTTPPYEDTVRPDAALSAFNGENAQGTWTLAMCDTFTTADDGTFLRGELIFNGVTPADADLSLALAADNTSPDVATNVTLTVTLTNSGPDAADGITVDFPLPSGLSYVSDDAGGAYASGTGVWTVPGPVASGGGATLNVVATVNSSGSYAAQAEVSAAGANDADSTPGNASSNPFEDDTATVTLTPGATGGGPGAPPPLSCSVADQTVLDWDSNTWTSGATTQSFSVGGLDFDFAITGSNNFINGTPQNATTVQGGLPSTENTVLMFVNHPNLSGRETTTIDVGVPGTGVEELQFTIFDVDTGDFVDRLTVSGSLGGVDVSPTLTGGTSVVVAGSVAQGTAGVASSSGAGNVTITFTEPVDQVVFAYDNGIGAPSDPAQQLIAMHDLTVCPRQFDFGDALVSYGAPSHIISNGFQIGAVAPDGETGPQPTASATGDDANGTDDEDASVFSGLVQTQSSTLNIPVVGTGGFLQAWIDWNGDGDFNDTVGGVPEQVASNLTTPGASGVIAFSVTPPSASVTTETIARLRWSSTPGLNATAAAGDGEVEDHALTIAPPPLVESCPAGSTLASISGNADTVITASQFSANALGPILTAGSSAGSGNSARVRSADPTLVLGLEHLTPENASITVSIGRDNGSGDIAIDLSDDGLTFTQVATFNADPNDTLSHITVIAPAGGAEFIRFRRLGGATWVDGVAYTSACLSASLEASKSTAVYDPLSQNLLAVPGNDVTYTITVRNVGGAATDPDSIELIDRLPSEIEFFAGDNGGPGGGPVAFSGAGSGLTFSASDVRFSNAPSPPVGFLSCSYSPSGQYDPNVTYVCLNPKGALAAGDPDPEFSVTFRARIK
ncbi:MAG: GEVED domain-containing protein [Pseudomonadota bacterium]